jgi:hypothetical protein
MRKHVRQAALQMDCRPGVMKTENNSRLEKVVIGDLKWKTDCVQCKNEILRIFVFLGMP